MEQGRVREISTTARRCMVDLTSISGTIPPPIARPSGEKYSRTVKARPLPSERRVIACAMFLPTVR